MGKIRDRWDQFQRKFAQLIEQIEIARGLPGILMTESMERIAALYPLCVYTRSGFPERWRNLWRYKTLGHEIRWINEYISAFSACGDSLPIPENFLDRWNAVHELWNVTYREVYSRRYEDCILIPDEKCESARQPWVLRAHRNQRMTDEAEKLYLYWRQQQRDNGLALRDIESRHSVPDTGSRISDLASPLCGSESSSLWSRIGGSFWSRTSHPPSDDATNYSIAYSSGRTGR